MPPRSVALLLAVSLVGCAAAREVASLAVVKPVRVPIIGAPRTPHRSVTFNTFDGLRLKGWLFLPEGAPRGVVVLLHGLNINRQHLVMNADLLLARGYAVLAYDQRGHGASEGEWCTYGVREVEDLRRALDRLGPVAEHTIVIGESMGAAVALQAAAADKRIRGVVAGASFSDLRTLVTETTPRYLSPDFAQGAVALAEKRAGFRLDDVSPARAAGQIHTPVLLLHGTKDTLIGPAHAQRILDHLAGPKRLVWLSGVGHVDVLLYAEAWDLIGAWLDELSA